MEPWVNTDNTQLKVADSDISLGTRKRGGYRRWKGERDENCIQMTFICADCKENIISHVGLCPETEAHDTNTLSCDTNAPSCDTNAPSCDDHVGCDTPQIRVLVCTCLMYCSQDANGGDGSDGDGSDGDGEQYTPAPSRRSSRKKPSLHSSYSSKKKQVCCREG